MKYEVTIMRSKIANCEMKCQKLCYEIITMKKKKKVTILFYFCKMETGFHKMAITHAFNKNTLRVMHGGLSLLSHTLKCVFVVSLKDHWS